MYVYMEGMVRVCDVCLWCVCGVCMVCRCGCVRVGVRVCGVLVWAFMC